MYPVAVIFGMLAAILGIINGVISASISAVTGDGGGMGFMLMPVGIFAGLMSWFSYYSYDEERADQTAETIGDGIAKTAEKTAKTMETVSNKGEELERKAKRYEQKKRKEELERKRQQAIKHSDWQMKCPYCGQIWTRTWSSPLRDVPAMYGMNVIGVDDTLDWVEFQCLECNNTKKIQVNNADRWK